MFDRLRNWFRPSHITPDHPKETEQEPQPIAPNNRNEHSIAISEEWETVINHINSGKNVFITGQAGTGKSTLIRHIQRTTPRKVALLAPTGIAALNLRGQTIHSFCHFPPKIITNKHIRTNPPDRAKAQAIDLLVIDEVSMVRCDLLDGLDKFMRENGRDSHQPFGGAQVVFVGDPLQLPPVAKSAEASALECMGYKQFSFWGSHAWSSAAPVPCNLTTVHRQAEDPAFLNILGNMRWGNVNPDDLQTLNACVTPNFRTSNNPFYPTLTPLRRRAAAINDSRLQELPATERRYAAELFGTLANVDEYSLPCEKLLCLKTSAPVMFTKNNAPTWYNGTLGIVRLLEPDHIIVELPNGDHVAVQRAVWEDARYAFDTAQGELRQEVVGKACQFPLTLAWAMTINKAQGLGFSHLHIDLRGAFAGGQAYVALSRCRSLDGLKLAHPLFPNNVMVDPAALKFMTELGAP